jgi:drug/metabolite transporter (DMT)-like permease
MSVPALLLVLAAALLHAIWNALAKRGDDPLVFLWSSFTLATLVLAPVAGGVMARQGFSAHAIPFVVATVALHAVYFYSLGRSYGAADFSVVYPVARGLGVALVPITAFVFLDERLSAFGAFGVGLVALGIATLSVAAVTRVDGRRLPRLGAGTGWALLTGLTIGFYSIVDKAGVAHLHPVPYIFFLGAGSSALLAPVLLARPDRLRSEWARHRGRILIAATMNLTAYLLVLFAFRLSKAAYVVAGRELSIVLSTVIGAVWLGEARFGSRLLGAAIILAGVVCIALAR